MKIYGIDAHLLLRENATGVPRYAWFLLREMMKTSLEANERVVLYGHLPKPKSLELVDGWSWKVLHWPFSRGWTHGRLSLEMLMNPPSVLFVPGHEVPLMMRKSLAVVTTIHDIAFRSHRNVYDSSSIGRQDLAVRRAIHRAQILLTPSESTKRDLESLYGVRSESIVVTPLAPTLPLTDKDAVSLMRTIRVNEGEYIFAIGRLEKKKNTTLLIRAFANLQRKLGAERSPTLVLAGSFGYGGDEIQRVIDAEGVADSVRILGYVDDATASMLLRHAMCFVFPSIAEGFGIPVLEAMEHGVPVIASDISVMKEVCGDAAVLVSSTDVAAWSTAIEAMMDESRRAEYRQKGLERVRHFSWEKTATATWEALRRAVVIR